MNYSPLRHDSASGLFEFTADGKPAQIRYNQLDEMTYALVHTEVDPSLEGKGVGSELVQQVLEYADAHNWRIVPSCPFVAAYIRRHPNWKKIVAQAVN